MIRSSLPWRMILAGALVLGGCATRHFEAPPAVIEQPPDITADQAVRQSDRARRSRPTTRSTADILRQNAEAAYPLDFEQRLDHAHDLVYTGVQRGAEATDRKFADKDKPLEPVPASPFRLGLMLESIDRSDGMEFNFNANLDIALNLPNIEKRLRIFITSDDLDESPDTARDRSGLRAGVRYQLVRYLDFDLGVRIDAPPVAFASLKWTREIQLGQWDFYPLAKLFLESKDGFGAASGATFDRWSGRTLFRASTYAKWLLDDKQTGWSQSFVFARAHELIVPDRYGSYPRANDIGRGWGVHVLASGEDTSEVTYYEAAAFYARPMANRWLFWSIEPLVNWDRRYNWKADPGIRVSFNALFWDLARPARTADR
ncbi:MAG: hypothetical protein ABI645_05905 [Pseudomonadota bacterium]